MTKKSMVRKVFVNKKNKQLTVPLSRKEIKKIDPTIRFSDNLFAKIEIFRRKNGNRSTIKS
jgi:hypothetical protein